MSLEELEMIFIKIKDIAAHQKGKAIELIWHGGEPLLINSGYYQQIWNLEAKIFENAEVQYSNIVQTNLTVLDDNYLALMKKGFFDSIGVSFDLTGNHRVNMAGKSVQQKVEKNIQKLIACEIPFGAITVLTHEVLERIEEVYHYFDNNKIQVRFLPLIDPDGNGNAQPMKESITDEDVVVAYKKLFDCWLDSTNATDIAIVSECIDIVIKKMNEKLVPKHYYQKQSDEVVFVIDTNGNIYPNDDDYNDKICYGNIFKNTAQEILNSENRKRLIEESKNRIATVCTNCEYYGYCSGYYLGDAIVSNYDSNGQLVCSIIKPTLEYIDKRLMEENMFESLTQDFSEA